MMKDMKKLVEQVVAAEYELQQFVEDEPASPIIRSSANPADVDRLAAYLAQLGLPFPPSYRKFLTTCDGIRGFMSHFSLLSVAEILKGPTSSQKRNYPDYAPFVVGRGESLEFLAFDTKKRHGNDMELVFVTDEGEESRYADMSRFLEEHLVALNEALAEERDDRKGLKD
jgi:hypothetical protein